MSVTEMSSFRVTAIFQAIKGWARGPASVSWKSDQEPVVKEVCYVAVAPP